MSFSTKSSRDACVSQTSSQANVTFKTISLFRTHVSECNTLSGRNVNSFLRRFDGNASCCLRSTQIDRSLCIAADDDRHVIHNLCVAQENRRGNSLELHAAVVGASRVSNRPCKGFRRGRRLLSPKWPSWTTTEPVTAVRRMRGRRGGMRNLLSTTMCEEGPHPGDVARRVRFSIC